MIYFGVARSEEICPQTQSVRSVRRIYTHTHKLYRHHLSKHFEKRALFVLPKRVKEDANSYNEVINNTVKGIDEPNNSNYDNSNSKQSNKDINIPPCL